MQRHGRRVAVGALTLLMVIGVATEATAAPGIVWDRVEGIYGSSVRCLTATEDGALLAGTNSGLFRSDDEGESWEPSGFVDGTVLRLEADGNIVYAGVDGDRRRALHRSDDGGRTWGLTDLKLVPRGLVARDGVVYGIRPAVGDVTRVYRSEDRGATWSESQIGDARGVDIAATGAAVYAVSANIVYRSANGQDAWEDIGPELPDDTLVALATLGETVYVAAEAGGVYRFDEDGGTWARTSLEGVDIEWLVSSGGVLYAGTEGRRFAQDPGIVRSKDGGATWVDVAIGEGAVATNAVVVGGREYVAGDGVLTLDGDGVSWRNVSRGMSDMDVFSVAVDGSQIYVGTESGVHVSDDAGGTWRHTDLYRDTPSSPRPEAPSTLRPHREASFAAMTLGTHGARSTTASPSKLTASACTSRRPRAKSS